MSDRFTKTETEALKKLTKDVDSIDYLTARLYLNSIEKYKSATTIADKQTAMRNMDAAKRDIVERTPLGALGAGMLRTAGDVVFGLPDLVTEGVNWLARKYGENQPKTLSDLILQDSGVKKEIYQAPTLGGLFRQVTGQSEGPKTPELAAYYNAPGYVAAAYGAASLAKVGWKAFKDRQLMKRADDLLGDLNPTDRNIFSNWMVKGQGSSSPEVAAMIEKLRVNPKYAEFFTAMEKEASKQALSKIVPRGSKQTGEEAASGIARAIENKLNGVKDARRIAGNDSFEKAYKTAGDAAFVDTSNTRSAIASLRKKYPDNKGVQAYLDTLENKLVPSFYVPPREGTQYVVREATPSRVIPGTPAPTTQPMINQVIGVDAAGMPITSSSSRAVQSQGSPARTIPGTPDVMGVIPGSAGYTVTQSPVKLTVDRIQGFLHEFGKRAEGSDSVVTQLSLDDMKAVNSALFGGLKQDLLAATKTGTAEQRKAAGYLVQAREQYAKASSAYDDLIAQGIPKWLQNKAPNEISLEELTKAYQKTNPAQRQLFRSWVGENRAESLQAIDKNVFDDFLKGTYKKLDDGTFGYDLGSMADKWAKLIETDPNKAGQVADALGTNASEFSKRMKDASVFTRKISVGVEGAAKQPVPGELVSSVSAAVGSTPASYQGAKLTQVGLEAVNQLFKKRGLSEEQLMKVILTDEGKQFLKNASLSPQSTKTLEGLTQIDKVALPGSAAALMTTAAPAPVVGQPVEQEQQWQLPPELGGNLTEQPTTEDLGMSQWKLPPELEGQ
jgi:hypothetical protein